MINISSITSALKLAIKSRIATPAKAIAGIILLCGLIKRPGLSTLISMAHIAEKLGVLGIPTEQFEDGTPNLMMQYAHVIVDEIYRALREDAKVSVVLAPGSVVPAPLGGPNVNIVEGSAIIQ